MNLISKNKINLQLIFLGFTLLIVIFAFILVSGCIAENNDRLYTIQNHYIYEDENGVSTIDFYEDGIAIIIINLNENSNSTTYWFCERDNNTVIGTIYKAYRDGELQGLVDPPIQFNIKLINDTSFDLTLGDTYMHFHAS